MYAILFMLLCLSAKSQQLYLELKGQNKTEDSLLVTYKPEVTFKDYKSLQSYSENLFHKIQSDGYLNLRRDALNKQNDSVLQLKLGLNKKYTHLYLVNYKDFKQVAKLNDSILPIPAIEETLYSILNTLSIEGKPFLL